MGWWWSSADSHKSIPPSSGTTPDPSPIPSESTSSTRESTEKPTSIASQNISKTRQDHDSFLPNLTSQEDAAMKKKGPRTTSFEEDLRYENATPFQRSMYPSVMSCRQLFDDAMWCRSPGSQLISLYRHGEGRDCSEMWADWRFCMSIKTDNDERRGPAVWQHYYERDSKKYKGKPNSEDVWEARTEPVEKAFWKDPDRWSRGKEEEKQQSGER
jgi:hypothetical protein